VLFKLLNVNDDVAPLTFVYVIVEDINVITYEVVRLPIICTVQAGL
jgi:hypothetical protein